MKRTVEKRLGKRPYLQIARRAATGTANLVVAGAGGVAAALLHSWPLAAVGALTYGAMVAFDMVNPSFWKRSLDAESKGVGGEEGAAGSIDPVRFTDPSARQAAEAIVAAQSQLERLIDQTGPEIMEHISATVVAIKELERQATALLHRAEELGRYVSTVDSGLLEREVARLKVEAERTTDADARADFEQARTAKAEQLRAVEDIKKAQTRSVAQLSRIIATFEGLPAKIVRMRALDSEALDRLSGDVNDELERINTDVHTFEQTLGAMLEVVRS